MKIKGIEEPSNRNSIVIAALLVMVIGISTVLAFIAKGSDSANNTEPVAADVDVSPTAIEDDTQEADAGMSATKESAGTTGEEAPFSEDVKRWMMAIEILPPSLEKEQFMKDLVAALEDNNIDENEFVFLQASHEELTGKQDGYKDIMPDQ